MNEQTKEVSTTSKKELILVNKKVVDLSTFENVVVDGKLISKVVWNVKDGIIPELTKKQKSLARVIEIAMENYEFFDVALIRKLYKKIFAATHGTQATSEFEFALSTLPTESDILKVIGYGILFCDLKGLSIRCKNFNVTFKKSAKNEFGGVEFVRNEINTEVEKNYN